MLEMMNQKWGWKNDPFSLKIDPKLFVGYEEQLKAINHHVEGKHKIALLTGPTGAGKTSLLKFLTSNSHICLYVSKPPENHEDFVDIFLDHFPQGFFGKLFKKVTLYNLPSYINKKIGKNQLLLLVDEAHETSREVLEWLRVLTDQIENVSLIVAGLPSLEQKLRDELETFFQRITTRVTLTALSEDETRELIKRRIESVGGSGTYPFTEEAISRIFQRTGGFPREVLKMCDRMIKTALEKNLETIDAGAIEFHKEIVLPKVRVEEAKVRFSPKPPSDEELRNIPYRQKKILEVLSREDWLTPSAIIEKMDSGKYKSRGHGVRSVNNILKRLMLDGFVQREARGKAFMYALTPKVKTWFVEK